MPQRGYNHRREFSMTCQKLALKKIYPLIFPPDQYRFIEVDDLPGDLAQTLDIGGVDKLLTSLKDGHLVLLSHRFREASAWNNPRFRDFTVRQAEWNRHTAAIKNGGTIPDFFGYGYANNSRVNGDEIDDFLKFHIVCYKQWLGDVLGNRTRSPYFKDHKNPRKENFYYIKWDAIPERYFHFSYPPTQWPLL